MILYNPIKFIILYGLLIYNYCPRTCSHIYFQREPVDTGTRNSQLPYNIMDLQYQREEELTGLQNQLSELRSCFETLELNMKKYTAIQYECV